MINEPREPIPATPQRAEAGPFPDHSSDADSAERSPSPATKTPAVDADRTLLGSEDDSIGRFTDEFSKFETRYELHEELGRGAFGRVYRGWDQKLGRWVAVKLARDESQNSSLFLREARAAAQLNHPHIVRVFDVGVAENGWFMISDYVTGQTLRNYLSTQRPTLETAVRWTAQVARALNYAHQQGIIHRDIKPGNIMIDTRGEPHVLDFGLARMASGMDSLGGDAKAIGTPAYMAPEQISPSFGPITPATDVFALGNVFFEMLAGQPPFEGDSRSVMFRAVHEEPPSLSRLISLVPPEVDAIFRRARARLSKDRYPSCAEFADDLENWLKKGSGGAAPSLAPTVLLPSSSGSPRASSAQAGSATSSSFWKSESNGWHGSLVKTLAIAGAGLILALLYFGPQLSGWSGGSRNAMLGNVPPGEAEDQRESSAEVTAVAQPARLLQVLVQTVFHDQLVAAELRCIPLDSKHGQPHPEQMTIGVGGVPMTLAAGRYVIIAIHEGHHQEVQRVVTYPPDSLQFLQYPQLASAWDAARQLVLLPGIRIHAIGDIDQSMANVEGGSVMIGSNTDRYFFPPQRFELPALLIDQREATVVEYQETMRIDPLWTEGGVTIEVPPLRGTQTPDQPVRGLSVLDAMTYAELRGKSLPTHAEWYFVVSSGNTRKYPWGDTAPKAGVPWPRTREESVDDITNDPLSIRGLFSGVCEPTQSIMWQPPNSKPLEPAIVSLFSKKVGTEYVIVGGPDEFLVDAVLAWEDAEPPDRAFSKDPLEPMSNGGVRCIHRFRPRFERP